jgi:Cu(I)/Ag(I) efflux system membrane fusion protein
MSIQQGSMVAAPTRPRLLGIALLAMAIAACSKQPSEPLRTAADDTVAEHAIKHTNPKYRCPMHPDVVRDEPGTCPICGMALVKAGPPATDPAAPAGSPRGAREIRISPAVSNNLGVRTEPVVSGPLPRRGETVGYVQLDERTVQQVRARAEGWVEGLSVRAVGETVTRGQLLFTLYSPVLESVQQEYLDALRIGNADLIDASRDRLRALGLDAGTAARLSQSGRVSGRVPFHAPISGVVTGLEAREGAMLSPGMPAMTITELGSLWVVAEVPESQSAWVRKGTHAEVRFPSQPGEPVQGIVEYVYPELNMDTRTLRARIVLETPPQDVRPNMLATVSLMAGEGDSVLHIPRSALIRDGSRARVVIALGEGRFTSRDVVAGAESGDRIAIHEGLEGGERVVVAAQFLLDSEANLGAGLDRLDDGAGAASTPSPVADSHAGHRQ